MSGRLRAALDVTDPNRCRRGILLWDAPGLPLFAARRRRPRPPSRRAYRLLADQLRRFAAGEPLRNVVTGDYY